MSLKSLIDKTLSKQPLVKPSRTKKRNAQPEAIEQERVIKWARDNENNYPFLWLLHSSLNGVKLSKNQAGRAKTQGMLSGVPDLFLPVPKNGFHGLYIEMKSEKGRVTENQHWFLTNAESLGYKIAVCYSAKEAISAIQAYYDQETIKGTTQDLPCLKTQNKAYSEGCCESH